MVSMRSCQKLPACPTEPTPASSKMDPPLAKAKPTRNGGNASVIAYLSRERSPAAGERSETERNNSADTKVSAEGGGGGARDVRAEIFSLQPVEQTMVRQAVPLQPMEAHAGAACS